MRIMVFMTINRQMSMLTIKSVLAVVWFCCVFSTHQSIAGPLTSAEVTKIINRVSVVDPAKGEHPAMLRDVIKDDLGLQTGTKSRSELLFQDNTLTRIGAETFFSFKTGTRDMTLEKGSMLLQVPKGLGGAKIHTAAVTAAITGTTIMMEYRPGQYLKVLVLEGSLRLSRNGSFGDSLVLRPGKMVIMRPDAKRIPDPVDVDLAEIVKTSTLVNFPGGNILPSMPLIRVAINDQAKELAKGSLVPTNLVMGQGTKVILASKNLLGSGPAVSVSSSTQIVSLLGKVAPSSGGTITVTPSAVNASGNVASISAGAVSANAGSGSVNAGANVSLGSATSPANPAGTLPTLSGPPVVGSNPTALNGIGSLPGQDVVGPPPGH